VSDVSSGVELDTSRDVLRRAPGCLLAFVLFVILFTVADLALGAIPGIILSVVGVALGFVVLLLYGRVVATRWGINAPDPVQLMAGDLTSVRRRSAHDFRLKLPPRAPMGDRILHELLYALKWLGTLLVFAGLGSVLYRVMVLAGLVDS
jgi:hypothetical protein